MCGLGGAHTQPVRKEKNRQRSYSTPLHKCTGLNLRKNDVCFEIELSFRKGINAENQLIRLLKDRGYDTIHSSGSRGSVDVIASKKVLFGLSGKRFAIQVKTTASEVLRVSKKELGRLRESAHQHDGVAVLAVRFPRERWRFWSDEEESFLMVFADTSFTELESGKGASTELSSDGKTGKLFEQVF